MQHIKGFILLELAIGITLLAMCIPILSTLFIQGQHHAIMHHKYVENVNHILMSKAYIQQALDCDGGQLKSLSTPNQHTLTFQCITAKQTVTLNTITVQNNGLFHMTPNTPAKRIVHGIQHWHVHAQEPPLKKWAVHITLHACQARHQQHCLIKTFSIKAPQP